MFEEQDNWSSSASSSRSSSPYFINEEPSKLTTDKNKKEDQTSHHQQHHASLLPSAAPQPSKTVVSGFHKPGDKSFSLVAVPPEHLLQRESENLEKASKAKKGNDLQKQKQQQKSFSGSDAQGIGSSVWASKECRCLRCEMLRTSSLWSLGKNNNNKMKNSTRAPMILVLMDADNFGFHAFSKKPTSNTLFQYVSQEGNSVFVWAFYGANFRKDFHQDLEQFIQNSDKKQIHNNNNNNNKFPKHLNTWGYLHSKKSIQATKCEGSAQAADLVIEAVASLLVDELKEENIRCSLITGDLGLRRAVGKIWQEVDDENKNKNKKMLSYYIPELTRGESDPDVVWRSILNGFSSNGGSKRQSQTSQGQRRGRGE